MKNIEADVVVVGAGTAGAHVAWQLAGKGHSVVLVENKERDQLGHDWWDGVTRKIFPEVGLALPEPPERMNDAGRSKIYPPGGLSPIAAEPNPDILIVDRKLLIRRQLSLAEEAGVNLLFGKKATAPLMERDQVAGVLISSNDGDKTKITSRITIDASGIAGVIRSKIGNRYGFIEKIDSEDTMFCYREIRKRRPRDNETMYMFGERDLRWINREQDGMVDFFAGVIGRDSGLSPKELVDGMVMEDPGCGELVRGGHGGLIPLRHCMDSFVASGLMVVGDAACQCNPINGSGIASSLRAAGIAAVVARDALCMNDTSIPALWKYNFEYKRKYGHEFALLHALQRFFVLEPRRNIEKLFRYGIVSLGQLRGAVDTKGLAGPKQVAGLVRMADRPGFIVRLVVAVSVAGRLSKHFRSYPAKYSEAAFDRWKNKKNRLFKSILRMYR